MIEMAIVRHGETDWNHQGRMQGHRDIELNMNGLRQAELIAKRLSEQRWDAVYSSDLKRAAVTAAKIASAGRISNLNSDHRLRERHFGRLEGTTESERIQEWGEDWETLEHGAEHPDHLFERATFYMNEMLAVHPGQRIIVVTHGGWIRQVFGRLFPDLEVGRPGNTALSMVRYDQGLWTYSLYNCTQHLNQD